MKIVIVGAGEIGSHLAKMLSHEGGDICVLDSDASRLARISSVADVAVVNGNPTSIKALKEAGAHKADLFISVFPYTNQEINIVSALFAKNLGAKKVTARINNEEYLTPENRLLFKEMGVELLFYPEKIAADEITDQIKHTGTTESMDFARGKLQIVVFKLDDDSPLIDLKLGEFAASIADDSLLFRVIAISRNEQTIIPRFDTKFQYNDLVYAITLRDGLPDLLRLFGKSSVEVDSVMIMGGSTTGELVAKSLSKQLGRVKIIEKDRERCLELSSKLDNTILISNGDGRNSDFLLEEGIKDFDAFVALTESDEANILACVAAKKFGIAKTVAGVENLEYIRLAEEMGVDTVINRKLITAGRIFKFTLSGKARFVKYMSGTNAEALEYTAAPDSRITTAALKDLNFPKEAIIGGVIRGSESFIAVGDTRIEAYDRVAVFALPEAVKEVDKFFK